MLAVVFVKVCAWPLSFTLCVSVAAVPVKLAVIAGCAEPVVEVVEPLFEPVAVADFWYDIVALPVAVWEPALPLITVAAPLAPDSPSIAAEVL